MFFNKLFDACHFYGDVVGCNSECFPYFLVTVFFKIQGHNGFVNFVELCNSAVHALKLSFALFGLIAIVLQIDGGQRSCGCALRSFLPGHGGVQGDPIQPRAEFGITAVRAMRLPSLDQYFLKQIFAIVGIGGINPTYLVDEPLMRLQLLKSLEVCHDAMLRIRVVRSVAFKRLDFQPCDRSEISKFFGVPERCEGVAGLLLKKRI